MRVLPVILDGGRGQGQKYALPEMSVKGGQSEAESYTKSGEEAKGGEEMTRLICAPLGNPELIYLSVRKPKMKRWRNWVRAWNGIVISAFRRAKV